MPTKFAAVCRRKSRSGASDR